MMKRALTAAGLAAVSLILTAGTASAAPSSGDVLSSLGESLSPLTSDCGNGILAPLTGYQSGVLTTALLNQGTLLGDLTDARTGSLSNLTGPALIGNCH